MGVNVPTSSDYEAEANRVRREIDETVKEFDRGSRRRVSRPKWRWAWD